MKKVFLSVPMRGRTKENIEKSLDKMKAYVHIALDGDVEFINTIVKEHAPEGCHESVWCLGESIKKLSEADILVTVECPYWMKGKGVETERKVFYDYLINYDKKELQHIELPIYLVMDEKEFNELYSKHEKEEKDCVCCEGTANTILRG